MVCFSYKRKPRTFLSLLIIGLIAGMVHGAPGQSAVITLIFPPGARATGLGEAFTGLANDANAVYFNPAGLGQDPLANSWKNFLANEDPISALAAKRKSDLLSNETVWAGTGHGVQRYNGRVWESGEIYLIEQNDELASIARRYVNVDDEKIISRAAWLIRAENGIEIKRHAFITAALRETVNDSLLARAGLTVESLAHTLLDIPVEKRTAAVFYGQLSPLTDSTAADSLSDRLVTLVARNDTRLEDLVDLKIPFTIAVSDSVTAMVMDESENLWVGTTRGLWRCRDSKWSRTTVVDGLPSNHITALATNSRGDVAAGTDAGIGIYRDGRWSAQTPATGLPDSIITSVAFGKDNTIYAGTPNGLIRKQNSEITVLDTADGLLTMEVHALFFDSQERLWVGGGNGVALFTGTKWKRYNFPGSRVQCFAEQNAGAIWIGTDKGAVSYRDGKISTDKSGAVIEEPAEWKPYHSKNVLLGNNVQAIATYHNDVWLGTEKALNQYSWAQKQLLMFYEPLLPKFHLKDLWHTFGSFILPLEDWGTLGFSINFINMGVNNWTDELGRDRGSSRSWEGVFGLSYGLNLSQTFSTGINMKFVNSALAPGYGSHGAGVGTTYAIDAGILKRDLFIRRLNLGFMLQNMGPPIYYTDPDKSDPIPFTLRLGTAYTPIETPLHEITFLFDAHREVVKSYKDKNPDPFWKAIWTDMIRDPEFADSSLLRTMELKVQEINLSLGAEYWYSHFVAARTGFLFDYIGERYELTLGLGLNYGNMNFDWSYIYAPEGFMKGALRKINPMKDGATGARDNQWRASFLFRL